MNRWASWSWLWLSLATVTVASACSRAEPDPALSSAAALGAVPASIAGAKLARIGAICPIESVNGTRVRTVPALKAGTFAAVDGWSTIADAAQPTPPLVHLVLRPAGSRGEADAFIPGRRVPRHDPSSDDPVMRNAGYAVSGRLPAVPGRYQLFLWVGDARRQVACDTHETLELQ